MASFSGSSLLATDTVRPTAALLAKSSSATARTVHQGQSRIWHPTNGIVFGNNSSPEPSPARALSTIGVSNFEHDLSLKPNAADACLLKSSLEFPLSNSRYTRSPSKSGTDNDGSSWALSNTSQDLNIEDLRAQDVVRGKVDEEAKQENNYELHAPLAFQIPPSILQKAMDAAPGTKESFWSYKMFLGPEHQGVKVHYCRSKNTAESVAQYFLNKAVLGFDIEWKPDSTRNSGIKNNVSLIQLASETRIALFHIAAFPKDTVSDLVAPSLKKIMEDADTTKVGVAIKADCTRLRNFLKIDPKGILELSHLYKLVKHSSSGDVSQINKRLVSLSTQAEEHLQLPIFKGEVRGSDWTQALSIEQIKYAASDAYANFMLYDALECKRKQLRPVPPRPYHAELNLPIRFASGAIIATTDDAVEELEPAKGSMIASQIGPASVLEAAAENIQIEDDAEQNPNTSRIRTRPRTTSTDSTRLATSLPRPQSLVDAESWSVAHRAANPLQSPSGTSPPTVTLSALRVYALWYYNSSLSISDIASMLRDPPLRNSTVAAYILDAVRLEKLPFEKERLKKVLLVIPDSRTLWRYKGLWKLIE